MKVIFEIAGFRNALSLELIQSLHKELAEVNANPTARGVILAAEGPVFSSGHDLKQLYNSDVSKNKEIFTKNTEMLTFIQNMDIPVIAEVKGFATAAGCQLVATCDIVIAGQNALFSTPGAEVGLFCSTPGIALARAVPTKVAMDMLLTAEPIDAQRAMQIGLISRIVVDDHVSSEALKVATKIAALSRTVITLGKKFFYTQTQLPVIDAYKMGERIMIENLCLKDAQEGIAAFIDKRAPRWTHTNDKVY